MSKQLANHPKGWGAPRKGRFPKRKPTDLSQGVSAFGRTFKRTVKKVVSAPAKIVKAVSKSGRSYTKSTGGQWVEVRSYQRTKPTRKATAGERRVNSCAHTRKKKQMGPRRKR